MHRFRKLDIYHSLNARLRPAESLHPPLVRGGLSFNPRNMQRFNPISLGRMLQGHFPIPKPFSHFLPHVTSQPPSTTSVQFFFHHHIEFRSLCRLWKLRVCQGRCDVREVELVSFPVSEMCSDRHHEQKEE